MIKFIELHLYSGHGKQIFVNTDKIDSISVRQRLTFICVNGEETMVQETPDEIQNLIREKENE